MRTYYDILGVSRQADVAEIRTAYRELARTFHPDKHAGTPEAVQRHASDVMSSVNEAYETLSNPVKRAEYDDRLQPRHDREVPSAATVRPPLDDECLLCGSCPAVSVQVQRRVGLILWRRLHGLEGSMCRDCGIALVRDMTSRTLVTGWWGVISFFANFASLITNFNAWLRLRRLDAPRVREGDQVMTPLPRPMPVGNPLWQRAGFLVFVGALILVLVGGSQQPSTNSVGSTVSTNSGASSSTTSSGGSSGNNSSSTEPSSWPDLEGSCVTYTYDERIEDFVPCSQRHDGEIVEVTNRSTDCPTRSLYYFEIFDEGRTWILCMDG